MDNFVYMYTHAVVWLNYIGASKEMGSGLGHLQYAAIVKKRNRTGVVTIVVTLTSSMRREPDGRYVDHMHTL